MKDISKRVFYLFLLIAVTIFLAMIYPVTPHITFLDVTGQISHANMIRSYNNIPTVGDGWGIVGYYPFSTPVGNPIIISTFTQTTLENINLDIDTNIMVIGLFYGLLTFFLTICLLFKYMTKTL